jgi:hypothetical protein
MQSDLMTLKPVENASIAAVLDDFVGDRLDDRGLRDLRGDEGRHRIGK